MGVQCKEGPIFLWQKYLIKYLLSKNVDSKTDVNNLKKYRSPIDPKYNQVPSSFDTS